MSAQPTTTPSTVAAVDPMPFIKTKSTASLLTNNLTISANHVAYAHRSYLHIAPVNVLSVPVNEPNKSSSFIKVASPDKEPVTQLTFATLGNEEVLISLLEGCMIQVCLGHSQCYILHRSFNI